MSHYSASGSSIADETADNREESQNWETESAEELPSSQLENQSLPIRHRTFSEEIPDSQEDNFNTYFEGNDYEGLDLVDVGHHSGVNTNAPEVAGAEETRDNSLTNLPDDTPQNGRQLHFFHHYSRSLLNSSESATANPLSQEEIPETQEEAYRNLVDQVDNGSDIELKDYSEDSHDQGFCSKLVPNPLTPRRVSQDNNLEAKRSFHPSRHGQDPADLEADEAFDEEEPAQSNASFHTEDTEIIPGGYRLTKELLTQLEKEQAANTPKSERRYTLHKKGINVNGRLPTEAFEDHEMEETATQPNTQHHLDNRCLGMSKLSKQDEADIIAILHPASPAAHVAVNLTAQAAPQHIQQNHDDSVVAEMEDIDSEVPTVPRDLALRLSSRVNDLRMGFVFGRNVHKSDILLVREDRKESRLNDQNKAQAISNKHFRIFINRHGILMLEDTSTNGTIVDSVVLHGPKSQDQAPSAQPMITLHSGAMIMIPTPGADDPIRFIVTIPTRYFGDLKYNENLVAYLHAIAQADRKAAAEAEAEYRHKDIPPNVPVIDNALPAGLQQQATAPNTSIIVAGTSGNNHGLHWNGGQKYNVVGHIGSGAFATVCKLSDKRDGEVYAVKEIEKRKFQRDGTLSHKFHNELNVMMNARHPNIIEYKDHHETDTHLYIIMDFMPLGDLRHWTDFGKAMTEYMAARVGRQMLEALTYLHGEGITHRDIKPDNILVAGDDAMDKVYKLADFGLSKQIIDNQTFLQTFCGTLLYLAPEVYPGYERAKAGLPPRSKKSKTQIAELPYEHSVDIWSLGSVLYQLLAGKPPFSASSSNGGEMFLHTVMSEPVDYPRLKYGGISQGAVDFLSRMIVTDPLHRAREDELLAHDWLLPRSYPTINETDIADVAEGLAASQINLVEGGEGGGMINIQETEHVRGRWWRGEPAGSAIHETASQRARRFGPPPPPQTDSQMFSELSEQGETAGHTPPDRLFGEITSSALRSSGVLGQTANQALEVEMEGTSEGEIEGISFLDEDPADLASSKNQPLNTSRTDRSPSEIATRRNSQTLQTGLSVQESSGAPSLLGAEALVDQLNMASPEHSMSGDVPANPGAVKRSVQALGSFDAGDEHEHKRSRLDVQSSRAATRRQPERSATQQEASAPEGRSQAPVNNTAAGGENAVAGAKSNQTSQNSNSDNHQDGQQKNDRDKTVSLPATAHNSQESSSSSSSSNSNNNDKGKAPDTREKDPAPAPAPIYPSMYLAPTGGTDREGFVKPSMRFGNLLLTKDSIKSVSQIKVVSMGTSFGRNHDCTFIHPNPRDRRVPKNAFDIQMWYPGIEKDLAAGKTDWAFNANLTAVISTRTQFSIKINGVRLSRGRDCWLFGKLRTGDIISVVELPEGQIPKNDYERERLQFRCEFFIGASKMVRKETEPFKVEQEEEKYMRYQAKKSQTAESEGDDDEIVTTTTTTTVPTAKPSDAPASTPVRPPTPGPSAATKSVGKS